MREIIEFDGGNSAKKLAGICKQTKTAADWTCADFQTEAAQKTSKIFILVEKENNAKIILGFCAVRFAFETAEIINFAISPSNQRKHLGTELFAHTLNFLKARGVKEITLEVSSANITRKKFYNGGEDALLLKLNL